MTRLLASSPDGTRYDLGAIKTGSLRFCGSEVWWYRDVPTDIPDDPDDVRSELIRWRPGSDTALIVDRASPAGDPGGIACAEGVVTTSEALTVEPFDTSVYTFNPSWPSMTTAARHRVVACWRISRHGTIGDGLQLDRVIVPMDCVGEHPSTRTRGPLQRDHSPGAGLAEPFTYTGYVAPPRLKEHLALLNAGYCTFPYCHRHARAGDVDHQIPASRDGPTASANTHRPCRKHHRVKDKDALRVGPTAYQDIEVARGCRRSLIYFSYGRTPSRSDR